MQLTDEIAVLVQQVVSASRNGSEQDLARSIRRLTAIHAAHPRLLDEPGLEEAHPHRRSLYKLAPIRPCIIYPVHLAERDDIGFGEVNVCGA